MSPKERQEAVKWLIKRIEEVQDTTATPRMWINWADYEMDEWGYPIRRKKPEEKPDSRYPHKCPKCKQAAYIGFLQIEHQVENKECK